MLTTKLESEFATHALATKIQVRLRALSKGASSCGDWIELSPVPKPNGAGNGCQCTTLVREEDGLDLGTAYEFCVRIGDCYQLGPWSESSKPWRFTLPPPVPCNADECSGLMVYVTPTSATFKWPAYTAQSFSCPSQQRDRLNSLTIEYMIVVSMAGHSEPTSTLVTRDTQIMVQALVPGKAYTATLLGRWARFGPCWGDASPAE